jgi:unsaturated rhamnogalacturonyl hydrolase
MRSLPALLLLLVAVPATAITVNLYAPADGGIALGSRIVVDVRGCAKHPRDLRVRLDGKRVALGWSHGPYSRQWVAWLDLPGLGAHQLRFVGRCRGQTSFTSQDGGAAGIGMRVAARFMAHHPAKSLDWNWGPAVFLYGLQQLDPSSSYVRAYQGHWARKDIPTPDHADACPAALTALGLKRIAGDDVGMRPAARVAQYIATEPRNKLGALDHLGGTFYRQIFGDSIWVDSLMMIGVFAAQWGHDFRDAAMLDFAAAQPGIYASVLQDPATGLFRHAWKVNSAKAIPSKTGFWLRGNGWVLTSIVEILDELPPDSPRREELLSVFRRVVEGLKKFQQPTGLWDSIANRPGFSYGETSGTSLAAYAIAKAVHRGWLPECEMEVAKRAFAGVTAKLKPKNDGLSLPRISWSTNPMPLWLYGLIPALSDLDYGVGAYLMAASEMRDERF